MQHRPVHRATARLAAGIAALSASLALALALAGPAVASSVTVTIGRSLSPASVTISPGMTVTWRNADHERHRIRSRGGPLEFDSGNLDPGETWSVTLRTKSSYDYVDDRNRELSQYWGTITVATKTSPEPNASGSPSTPVTRQASAEIQMAGRQFRPTSVVIDAGGSVTWRNTDDRAHTATATDGSFNSGVIGSGATYRRRFTTPGTYRFLCAIHPEMSGAVTVRGGAAPAASPPPKAPAASATEGTSAGDGSGPAVATVRIVDFAFDRVTTTIPAGATVRWQNTGAAPHTATSANGDWDSGLIAAGTSFSRTFAAAGTYRYVCSFHPAMAGAIVVTAAAADPEPSPAGPAGPAAPAPPATPPPGTSPDQPVASMAPTGAPVSGPGELASNSAAISAEPLLRGGIVAALWLVAMGGLGWAVRSSARKR